MTTEQFTYWLQGFFELSGATTLNEEQVKVIRDHISLVMKKETPNSIGGLFDPKDPNIKLAQYLSKPYTQELLCATNDTLIDVPTNLTC